MAAVSGGDRSDDQGASPFSSVLERAGVTPDEPRAAAPARDRIFAPSSDLKRDALLQQTWTAFSGEMATAVEKAVSRDGAPTEVAYAAGEIVHNYFRARGATLTSYELRHVVSHLLDRHGVAKP